VLIAAPFDFGRILPRKLFSMQFFLLSERFQWLPVPMHIEIFVHIVENEL
jgi:hypothetical protein